MPYITSRSPQTKLNKGNLLTISGENLGNITLCVGTDATSLLSYNTTVVVCQIPVTEWAFLSIENGKYEKKD